MVRCWLKSPDDRPSFEDLNAMLKEILQEEEVKTLLIDKVKPFTIVCTMEFKNVVVQELMLIKLTTGNTIGNNAIRHQLICICSYNKLFVVI